MSLGGSDPPLGMMQCPQLPPPPGSDVRLLKRRILNWHACQAVLVLGLELGIVRSNARLAAEGILTILERLPNSIAHRRRVQVLQRRVQW